MIILFEISGGVGFKLELGTKARGHCKEDMGEELTNRERMLEIRRGRRLEVVRRKQNHEDE